MGINILSQKARPEKGSKIALMLGSFDPLHLGHEWMGEMLLKRCDSLLLLLPLNHPEKKIETGKNAPIEARIKMLESFKKSYPGRIIIGTTNEIYFVRLYSITKKMFPGCSIIIGTGSDTFEKILKSKEYFRRSGLTWSIQDESELKELVETAIVFDRKGSSRGQYNSPSRLFRLSSTIVRSAIYAHGIKNFYARKSCISSMISSEVQNIISIYSLYQQPDRKVAISS